MSGKFDTEKNKPIFKTTWKFNNDNFTAEAFGNTKQESQHKAAQ